MSELAPLLGRSPRTLKRFVNVYRLIKIGLSPYERLFFLRDTGGLPDFQAVLTLLAIDTGAPSVARGFLSTLIDLSEGRITQRGEDGNDRPLEPTAANLVSVLDDDASINQTEDWGRVRYWLHPSSDVYRFPAGVGRLARWVPRVSRFSFHTGRV
jgi:hypothetical protein